MYVGVTRAKDQLYLVRAFRRMLYGRGQVNEPSRFLRDAMTAKGVATDRGLGNGSSAWSQASRRAGPEFVDEDRWSARRAGVAGNDAPRLDDHRSTGGGAPSSSGAGGWAPGAYSRQPVRSQSEPDRAPQFKPGDRVDHALFGQGIVLKSELMADDEEVTVAFAGKGTKTLMASFAKLRKVG